MRSGTCVASLQDLDDAVRRRLEDRFYVALPTKDERKDHMLSLLEELNSAQRLQLQRLPDGNSLSIMETAERLASAFCDGDHDIYSGDDIRTLFRLVRCHERAVAFDPAIVTAAANEDAVRSQLRQAAQVPIRADTLVQAASASAAAATKSQHPESGNDAESSTGHLDSLATMTVRPTVTKETVDMYTKFTKDFGLE